MKNNKTKNILISFLFLASIFLLVYAVFFFSPKTEVDTGVENIKAVATIYPIYDIMKYVGGDNIETILLLPPGSSPHTFEATPQDVKDVKGTNLFLFTGAGIDTWAQNIVRNNINQGRSDYIAIDLSQVAEMKTFEGSQGHDEELNGEEELSEEEENYDPHYWLSPTNAVLIAAEVASHLSRLDPENKEYYRAQADSFADQLRENDIIWQEKIDSLENKEIIVFHDAWNYFADYFGLEIVATFEPFPGKTPTPQYLRNVQEKVEEYNINTLFIEPQLSQDSASVLTDNLVDSVEILDPLGGFEGRGGYIEMLDYNIETIYSALSK